MVHPRKRAASLRGWVSAEGHQALRAEGAAPEKVKVVLESPYVPPFPCPVGARGAGWGVEAARKEAGVLAGASTPMRTWLGVTSGGIVTSFKRATRATQRLAPKH